MNKNERHAFSPRISAIDLFCGVGGLTYGLQQGGIDVIAGVDLDRECQFPYEANNNSRFIENDLVKISSSELESLFPTEGFRLLAGCAPCQPFSTYNQKNSDLKWRLLKEFTRLATDIKPDFITMENVPKLLKHEVFQEFLLALRKDYHIWFDVVECRAYGIPQTRKRLIFLASLHGDIALVPPTHGKHNYITVRQAIGKLPSVQAGKIHRMDSLHTAPNLSKLNLKRIRHSLPGGTWRDWPQELIASCHSKTSGATYPSVYGRMSWDEPSPTITTQFFGYGNGRFGHPEQDRAITIREAAILQTFPKKYRFVDKGQSIRYNILGKLIGNAVPVRIGYVIAQTFIAHSRILNKI